MVTSDTRKVRSRPQSVLLNMNYIHVRVQLIQNLHIMNTSYNEHFLNGPVSVHYREVLLYIFFEFTCDSVIHFTCERTHNIHLFLIHKKNIENRKFSHHKINIYKSFLFVELYYCISTLSIVYQVIVVS